MKFDELELREELHRSIHELGHTEPTPIQEQAIPKVLEGRDLMCCAQTGTGKTAAFALPILHRLAGQPRAPIRALILVPTRELAIQVGKSFNEYGRHLEIITATIFGGVPFEPQEMILRHGADIVVATPGRLKDHIWRGNIDFRYTQFLVLDEADRMLDMGFIKDVRELVELMPTERQSMLFSATLDPEIQRFSKGILTDPLRIDVSPPRVTLAEIDQFLVQTQPGRKQSTLESLIRKYNMERAIVFARTKSGASRLASNLRARGYSASAIHGDRSQAERVRALEGFRQGAVKILVATDIAARGIDVDDISHVINYDLPFSTKDYVHRIGRTARAGRRGVAISLVTPADARGIGAIERLIKQKIAWDGPAGTPAPTSSAERTSAPSEATGRRRSTRPRRDDARRAARRGPRDDAGRDARGDTRRGPRDDAQENLRRRSPRPRRAREDRVPDQKQPAARGARSGVSSADSRRPRRSRREQPQSDTATKNTNVFRRVLRRLIPQAVTK